MIDVVEEMDRVVLKPDFDIMASRVGEIRDLILKTASPGKLVILDLSEADMIDSMGIGMVVACLKSVRRIGGEFKVVTNSQEIVQTFKLLKLDYLISSSQ